MEYQLYSISKHLFFIVIRFSLGKIKQNEKFSLSDFINKK